MPQPARRRRLAVTALLTGGLVAGCASLPGGEPPRVNVVGIEPLDSQGLELRMAVKLRVQNPNSSAIDYDGVSIRLDLRGSEFATGVSPEAGTVPRFGEALITVPATISALAVLRQAIGFASGDTSKVTLRLRGRLAPAGRLSALGGGVRFESTGEVDLPRAMSNLAP